MSSNEDARRSEREAARGVGEGHEVPRTDAGGQYLDESGHNEEHTRRDPGNPLMDVSLYALLIVVGAVLLLIPEPST